MDGAFGDVGGQLGDVRSVVRPAEYGRGDLWFWSIE